MPNDKAQPPAWADIANSDQFQSLARDRQERARQLYFQEVVLPQVPPGREQRAWELFDQDTISAVRPLEPESASESKASERPGVLGTLKEGAKSTGRALASAADSYLPGDGQRVVDRARAQQAAPKAEKLDKLYSDIESGRGENDGLGDALRNIGGAVVRNPGGAGLAVVEQLPNAAPALGGGWLGMKAGAAGGAALGSVVPGLGTAVGGFAGGVLGGLAGMFLGNAAIETGHKAMEMANDGDFTPEEASQARSEGAIKGGVITGVDAITLGAGRLVSSGLQRTVTSAMEGATRRTLVERGIDIADEAAVARAVASPEIATAVRTAQLAAIKATDSLRKRVGEGATLLAMESAGEGVGEYLGELAATGEADITDAVLESVLSLGQSGIETTWNVRGARARNQVQPLPTEDNPSPAPVDRPDPAAGALSRAAAQLPSPEPVLGLPEQEPPMKGGAGMEQQAPTAPPKQQEAAPKAMPDEKSPQERARYSWDSMNTFERNKAAQDTLGYADADMTEAAAKAWDQLAAQDQQKLADAMDQDSGQRWDVPNQKISDKDRPVLQNRDRSTDASIAQMQDIKNNPDYDRLSVSRDFGNGAPVVEPGADFPAAQLGRSERTTTSTGRKIPVQYAVVEADQLLPSNDALGNSIPEYANGVEGKSRAIAGNGRVAGITAAWKSSNPGKAEAYKKQMIEDTQHGIDPEVIRAMKQPVLVRIMPLEEVSNNIGDESNVSGQAGLSPTEQANTDMRRIDLAELSLTEDNELSENTVLDFIKGMPKSELGTLLTKSGRPTPAAYARAEAALFQQAYQNEALTENLVDLKGDAKFIMNALMRAAPAMAKLEGAGIYDIRPLVSEAAEVAVNARRQGIKLSEFIKMGDFGRNPQVMPILEMMIESGQRTTAIGDKLINLAQMAYAEANKAGQDMFGEVAKQSPEALMEKAFDGEKANAQEIDGTPEALGDDGRSRPDASNAEGRAADGEGQPDSGAVQADQPAKPETAEARLKKKAAEKKASTEPATEKWRKNYLLAKKRATELGIDPKEHGKLPGLVKAIDAAIAEKAKPEAPALDLAQQTEETLAAEAERLEQLQKEEAAQKAKQKAAESKARERDADKARADEVVDDFQLGQSAEDAMSGMGDIFSQPQDAENTAQQNPAQYIADNFEQVLADLKEEAKKAINKASKLKVKKAPDVIAARENVAKKHNLPATGFDEADILLGKALMPLLQLNSSTTDIEVQLDQVESELREALGMPAKQDSMEQKEAPEQKRAAEGKTRASVDKPTINERRASATLAKPSVWKELRSGDGTVKSSIERAVREGWTFSEVSVTDTAAKKRDEEKVKQVSKRYMLGLSNPNIPEVKAGLAAKARLDAGEHNKSEYRLSGGQLDEGSYYTITKTAYDYAKTLESNKPEAASPEPTAPKAPTEAIEDFGEKIGGARKDAWNGFKDDLNKISDDQIASQSLSKIWPEPNYSAMIESGESPITVALIRALREEITSKPRVKYKLTRWAESVREARSTANALLDGTLAADQFLSELRKSGTKLEGFAGRVELYSLVGHEKSLAKIYFAKHRYSLYRGEKDVTLWVVENNNTSGAFGGWPSQIATGKTKEQAIEAFKKSYSDMPEKGDKKAKQSFDIWSERGREGYLVGKKIGRHYAEFAGPFKTTKEAREYVINSEKELTDKLEKYREIPAERRDTERPRVGEDHRQGQDVTPEQFSEAFGFRGVEFGNWVEQGRRQADLNHAYDALMDMAAVLDVPAKAISLNGALSLAFGARGKGGKNAAKAHYEPGKVVINLSKRTGAGSLGHEWWHALDNYFSRARDSRTNYMTTERDVNLSSRSSNYHYADKRVRKEMVEAFGEVVKRINETALEARSRVLDNKRTKEYWTTTEEMSARAFESYLISKLQDNNAHNDYLANIVDESTWAAAEALGFEMDGSYPYPTAGEVPAIRAGFDHFFNTIESRETDSGVQLYKTGSQNNAAGIKAEAITDALASTPELAGVKVVQSFEDLPEQARKQAEIDGVDAGDISGIYFNGTSYVVADNHATVAEAVRTAVHEEVGHLGIRGLLGDKLTPTMERIYSSMAATASGRKLIKDIRADYGHLRDKDQRQAVAEELIAHLLETGDKPTLVQRFVSKVRELLRAMFPQVKWTNLDVLALGEQSRAWLRRGMDAEKAGTRYSAKASDKPQTKTAAFKKWFGNSKVVDANGEPLVVYHGSGAKFATFDKNKRGATTRAKSAEEGFFFTNSKSLAYDFKKQAEGAAADLDAIRSAVEGLSDSQLESLASDIGRIASEDLDLEGREFFIDSLMDMYQYDTDINTWPEESNGTPKVLKNYIPKDILEPGAVHDVYLRIENPHEHVFSLDDDWHDEGAITRAISIAKKNGNDGVILRNMVDVARADEKGNNAIRSDVYIAFEPDQIIQSDDSAGIRYSLKSKKNKHASESFSDLTDKQKAALNKIAPLTTQQKAAEWFRDKTDRALLKIRQGLVDRFAALRELDEAAFGEDILNADITNSSWVLARMSSAASGALHAMLNNGRIYLDQKQKVIDIQDGDALGLGATLARLGSPAEIERFMGWIAGNRSARLAAEGRENLFSADDIDALKTLNNGKTDSGKTRKALYDDVFKEFQQYRDDILAIAEQTGIITAENRALWRDEFYVPFYRVMDEDAKTGGPGGKKGLTRQEAYKKLKGGKQNLNDLLQNTMLNFNHLLTASLKNQAAAQALSNAEKIGVAEKTTEAARDKKASTFVLVDGKQQWYNIGDPLVFEALSMISDGGLNTAAVKVMSAFKRVFTNMTTITPQFIIANLLRDSMQATATSPVSKNFVKNIVTGGKDWTDGKKRARMMATGGAFSFGHIYNNDPHEMKAHLTRNLKSAQLLSSTKLIPTALKAGWDAWNATANAAENANRAAIFSQNEKSKGKLAAAFEARDLMDFSMHGAWPAVRFLIRVIPFLNARLQGLDKLHRSGVKPTLLTAFGKGNASDKQAMKRFLTVVGAISAASMALMLVNNDDEEYRKLEEWQKDTYWFVRVGDKAFFIPKPFEVGVIATMAERLLQQGIDDKATGELFKQRLGHALTETFAFSVVPHAFQPILDVYSNVDAFTDRPIESMSMERLSKGLRSRANTTAPAHALSAVSRALGDDFPLAVSPVQADHLIAGYLGQVGAWGAGLVDTMWRTAKGETQPARHWHEYQPIRRFYKDLGTPNAYTRYSTLFYEGLRESGKVYADLTELQRLGKEDQMRETINKNRDILGMRKNLNRAQRDLSKINTRIGMIRIGPLDADEKRREIDRLTVIKNRITEAAGKQVEAMKAAR